jgi:BASS family bile acid:Na+ symporter
LEGGFSDILVGGSMFALMFGMGLTLTAADFRRIMETPRPTIVGTLLQLMVMPLIGLAIARAYSLPPLLTAGLMVLAACPGGMFSNMYVHVARGHTALSITLTATATLVTLFTLPLWVRFALVGVSEPGTTIEMPVLDTALQLGTLTVLPVALGMWMRSRRPESVDWEKRLSISAMVMIFVGVTIDGLDRPDPPMAEFVQSIEPVAWFVAAALVIGTLIPALFRISARDGVTIAVELVVKNTLLGIVLVSQALDFEAIVPILVFMMFQTPAGILLLVGWRMLARFGYLEALPSPPSESQDRPLKRDAA